VDVGGETGGVIPNFKEVGGDLEAEGVDEDFEVGIEVFGFFCGLAQEVLEGLVEDAIGEEIFVAINGAFGGGFDSTKVIDKSEPLIEWTVGESDFKVAHGGGAEVGSQEAGPKSGAHMGNEVLEAAVGILAFRGVFAALIDDGSDDEVVETTAGDEFIDEFQLDAMVAVIFCRINDKGSWTKRHSVGKWVRQNRHNLLW
jgi:hypothetical protein